MASVWAGFSRPCGQIGRLVQTWTSRTVPMAPARTHSTALRRPSRQVPWLPIEVITPLLRAASRSRRASATVCVSGFCTNTWMPLAIAISAGPAWLWSGVLMVTASSCSLSSMSR